MENGGIKYNGGNMQNNGMYGNGMYNGVNTGRTQYMVNGQFLNQDNNYYDDYNSKQV